MTDTPLDTAHIAMEAAPDDDAARLRFYERLADAELFLLLEAEAEGDQVEPQIFPVEDARFVLAFDREDRLSTFTGKASPFVALSGRGLTRMLAGQGIGLGLNLGVAPSSILIPSAAVDWLDRTLGDGPDEVEAAPEEIFAPTGMPEALITALDQKLASAQGLARFAYLVGVSYETGVRSHMLAFIGAVPGAEAALASAVREALVFSGIEAGALDVAFFKASDQMSARLARHGLRFDLPEKVAISPTTPGSDPSKPPILR